MYAIVDIETTGGSSPYHKITEIAILLHDGNKVVDTYQTLINPERSLPPFITSLTGITNEMLQEAPKFYEVARDIFKFTENAVFVAHSVNFDYNFIRDEFKSLGGDFRRKKLCTVRLSRKIFPGYRSYSLSSLCSRLGVQNNARHRAFGDAEATAKIFDLLLLNDADGVISKSLKKESREAILPPNLPKEIFEKLPEETGVYYMHNEKGKVIYVGKAINIKSRIYSHFTGSDKTKITFKDSIHDISFTLTGTELIALLLESHEIKKLFPQFNKAQKFNQGGWALFDYFDNRGIHRLTVGRNQKKSKPLISFKSFEASRNFMFKLIEEFELCPKCCGVQTSPDSCFDYKIHKCKGVCAGAEEIESYNIRVGEGLRQFSQTLETKFIVDRGRKAGEKSLVLIEKGAYKGFGYFDQEASYSSLEEVRGMIEPYRENEDVKRILRGYFEGLETKGRKKIHTIKNLPVLHSD